MSPTMAYLATLIMGLREGFTPPKKKAKSCLVHGDQQLGPLA
jgi:hypothetical protein